MGRVEGQQVGLVGDLVDELDDGADLAGLLGEAVDLLGGGGGVFGQDVQAAGDLGGGLAARHRDMGRLEGAGLFFAEPGGHGGEALLGTGQGSAEQGQITQHGLEGLALAVLGLRQGLLLGEQQAEFDKLGVEGLLTSGEREVFGFERCNALFFLEEHFGPWRPGRPGLIVVCITAARLHQRECGQRPTGGQSGRNTIPGGLESYT